MIRKAVKETPHSDFVESTVTSDPTTVYWLLTGPVRMTVPRLLHVSYMKNLWFDATPNHLIHVSLAANSFEPKCLEVMLVWKQFKMTRHKIIIKTSCQKKAVSKLWLDSNSACVRVCVRRGDGERERATERHCMTQYSWEVWRSKHWDVL